MPRLIHFNFDTATYFDTLPTHALDAHLFTLYSSITPRVNTPFSTVHGLQGVCLTLPLFRRTHIPTLISSPPYLHTFHYLETSPNSTPPPPPQYRQCMDMKVFVDTDSDIRLARRLKRDICERGRDLRNVFKQYQKFVKPAFDHHIEPMMVFSDIIVPRG